MIECGFGISGLQRKSGSFASIASSASISNVEDEEGLPITLPPPRGEGGKTATKPATDAPPLADAAGPVATTPTPAPHTPFAPFGGREADAAGAAGGAAAAIVLPESHNRTNAGAAERKISGGGAAAADGAGPAVATPSTTSSEHGNGNGGDPELGTTVILVAYREWSGKLIEFWRTPSGHVDAVAGSHTWTNAVMHVAHGGEGDDADARVLFKVFMCHLDPTKEEAPTRNDSVQKNGANGSSNSSGFGGTLRRKRR